VWEGEGVRPLTCRKSLGRRLIDFTTWRNKQEIPEKQDGREAGGGGEGGLPAIKPEKCWEGNWNEKVRLKLKERQIERQSKI
jgi:hypothetical protein